MKFLASTLLAAGAYASPPLQPARVLANGTASAQRKFLDLCRNPSVLNTGDLKAPNWVLGADCPDYDDVMRFKAVELDRCIANDNGYLEWGIEGNFSAKCKTCAFQPRLLVWWFDCVCTDKTGREVTHTAPSIDINEHISYNGKNLLCDLE
ncbi:uncharacterized protein DNG_00257 [Cephalotrichum gorgonifer]|uniref:Cyanovirin-N domain-containing protein n=1 Tax=Cephalotrichum gorgonifer TaxID=2041049 RepID=A0AAE8SR08_9PEZI|nr:uncharacterized protein DNG_00257 [Cephalotrichum gorgonifer]